MTEEKTAEQATSNAPAFRMLKMFIRDLSFENPHSPEIFLEQNNNPKVDINLEVKNKKVEEDKWEVALAVTASFKSETGKTIFIIEIEHAAVYLIKNFPEEHVPTILAVDCPTLLFPYTRQIMSQLSVDGGFMPFLMDPVNFMGLYENARKKQPEGEKTQ